MIPLINAAKKNIRIIVFDWRWYTNEPGNVTQLFNNTIVLAHKKGVDVKVITNITETRRTLLALGIKAKGIATAKLVHPKMMIIDDTHLVIGSHNYTQNAFSLNYECSIMVQNCDVIGKYMEFFDNLY